jgi:murein DD-endopeptidase MepM/ murein hydrolase activator NlpD
MLTPEQTERAQEGVAAIQNEMQKSIKEDLREEMDVRKKELKFKKTQIIVWICAAALNLILISVLGYIIISKITEDQNKKIIEHCNETYAFAWDMAKTLYDRELEDVPNRLDMKAYWKGRYNFQLFMSKKYSLDVLEQWEIDKVEENADTNAMQIKEVLKTNKVSKVMDKFDFSSLFGQRRDPVKRYRVGGQNSTNVMHNGIDIIASSNSVLSLMNGVVIESSDPSKTGGYGNKIMIDHRNGLVTVYAHLSKRLVGKGDEVKSGQLIGITGNTGKSTGEHLHFETIFNGEQYNPLLFLEDLIIK